MEDKRMKKLMKNTEEILEEVWKDPMVQEYFENQKHI